MVFGDAHRWRRTVLSAHSDTNAPLILLTLVGGLVARRVVRHGAVQAQAAEPTVGQIEADVLAELAPEPDAVEAADQQRRALRSQDGYGITPGPVLKPSFSTSSNIFLTPWQANRLAKAGQATCAEHVF